VKTDSKEKYFQAVNANKGVSDMLLSQRLILNSIQNENKRFIASKESEQFDDVIKRK